MRIETKTYEIYQLYELSKSMQRKAFYNWLGETEYNYELDNRKTLEKFEELFSVKVTHFEYDANIYSYRFDTSSSDTNNLHGLRLAKYIYNNYGYSIFKDKSYYKNWKCRKSKIFVDTSCPLTGYCADMSLLEPILRFLDKPNKETSFRELINTCLNQFFRFCRDDVRYTQSEEAFRETNEANSWEYFIDGKLFT